ncbi:MAG: hypothetical protein ACE145_15335 [Terriglobia bacterium]
MAESHVSSDHFLEIRFKPLGSFLDMRGRVADFISEKGLFRHWLITQDRIEFWNADDREDDPERAFAAYKNCGYQVHTPPTKNYFSDRASKFVSTLGEAPEFRYPTVERLGVRAKLYYSVAGASFEDIVDAFQSKLLVDSSRKLLGTRILDFGLNLDFREKGFSLNVRTGPMKKTQFVKEISPFSEDEQISDSGIFLDVDVFRLGGDGNPSSLTNDIKAFHSMCWERLALLANFLGH